MGQRNLMDAVRVRDTFIERFSDPLSLYRTTTAPTTKKDREDAKRRRDSRQLQAPFRQVTPDRSEPATEGTSSPSGADTTVNTSGLVSLTSTPSPGSADLRLSSANSLGNSPPAMSSNASRQHDMTPSALAGLRVPPSWETSSVPGDATWATPGNTSHDSSTTYNHGGITAARQASHGALGVQPPAAAPPTPYWMVFVVYLPHTPQQQLVPMPAPHERSASQQQFRLPLFDLLPPPQPMRVLNVYKALGLDQ